MSYTESYLDHLNYYNTLLPQPPRGSRTFVPPNKNYGPFSPNITIPPQLCSCSGAGCSRCMPNNNNSVRAMDEGMIHVNQRPIGMSGNRNQVSISEGYRSFNAPYNQPYGPDRNRIQNSILNGRMFFTQNRTGETFVGVGPSYLTNRGPNLAEAQDAQELNSIWGGDEGFFGNREGASLGRRSGPMVQRTGGRIISGGGRGGGRGGHRGRPGGRPWRGSRYGGGHRRPIVITGAGYGYGPYADYGYPSPWYPRETVYVEKDSTPQVLSPEQCDFKYEKCLEKQQKPKSDDAKTNCLNYVQNTGCAYYKK